MAIGADSKETFVYIKRSTLSKVIFLKNETQELGREAA